MMMKMNVNRCKEMWMSLWADVFTLKKQLYFFNTQPFRKIKFKDKTRFNKPHAQLKLQHCIWYDNIVCKKIIWLRFLQVIVLAFIISITSYMVYTIVVRISYRICMEKHAHKMYIYHAQIPCKKIIYDFEK